MGSRIPLGMARSSGIAGGRIGADDSSSPDGFEAEITGRSIDMRRSGGAFEAVMAAVKPSPPPGVVQESVGRAASARAEIGIVSRCGRERRRTGCAFCGLHWPCAARRSALRHSRDRRRSAPFRRPRRARGIRRPARCRGWARPGRRPSGRRATAAGRTAGWFRGASRRRHHPARAPHRRPGRALRPTGTPGASDATAPHGRVGPEEPEALTNRGLRPASPSSRRLRFSLPAPRSRSLGMERVAVTFAGRVPNPQS